MARVEAGPPRTAPVPVAAVVTPSRRWPLLRRLLAVADACAVIATALVAAGAGHNVHAVVVAATLPLWLVFAKLLGLFDRDQRALSHQTIDEVPRLVTWAASGTAVVALVVLVATPHALSASTAILIGIVSFGFAVGLRSLARIGWQRVTPPEPALVVGDALTAAEVARKFEFAAVHVTVADVRSTLTRDDLLSPQPWLEQAERIVVSTDVSDPELLALLLAHCRRHQIRLSLVPPMRDLFGSAARLDRIVDLPVVEYDTWHVPRSTMWLKRCIDLIVCSVALVLFLPVMVVVAVAIALVDGRPIFFTQLRAGRHGEAFRMLKFRTMKVGGEGEPAGFKLRHDPRVTRVGRVLRRWSLDELPQLVNVLRGEMSLVGPRPEQVELVAEYDDAHRQRLAVRPGLTGPMQVFGRGSLRLDERLALERHYIDTLSLRLDFRIVMLTLAAIVTGRGAY